MSDSTVPSPPSAIGTFTISQSGNSDKIPLSAQSHTSFADMLSLKESGAITTFILFSSYIFYFL